MIKLFSKLGMSSGIVTGACLVNIPLENMCVTSDKKKLKKIKTSVNNIDSLVAIELFEKANGCSFAFVQGWGDKKVYKFKEFLKKEKDPEWKSKVINGANGTGAKEECKTKGTVALFNGGSGFWNDKAKFSENN